MILGDQANFFLTANIVIIDFWHLLYTLYNINSYKNIYNPEMNKMNISGNWSYQENCCTHNLLIIFLKIAILHYFYEAILTQLYYTQNI